MDLQDKTPLQTSLTYREWLIGLIVAGIASNPEFDELTQFHPEEVALMASRTAFAVIEHLNSEVKDAN